MGLTLFNKTKKILVSGSVPLKGRAVRYALPFQYSDIIVKLTVWVFFSLFRNVEDKTKILNSLIALIPYGRIL